MGLFSGLEGNLEKYIEGFFKDKFKGRVQPVEIAKRLAREMREKRRVSISKTYVPNEYTVLLNPEDWESIGSFDKLLSLELQDYLVQKAQEKTFTLVAPPVVIIEKKEGLAEGHIEISSSFGEAIPVSREALRLEYNDIPNESGDQHTQMFKPFKDTYPLNVVKQLNCSLKVEKGRDKGKEFDISSHRVVIGRKNTCDIVLTDPSVSRQHAQLDNRDNVFVLTDLKSTNGTLVNGVPITKKMLEPGDFITFGTTICKFKVE